MCQGPGKVTSVELYSNCSAIVVSWKDPTEKNGIITYYTIVWTVSSPISIFPKLLSSF